MNRIEKNWMSSPALMHTIILVFLLIKTQYMYLFLEVVLDPSLRSCIKGCQMIFDNRAKEIKIVFKHKKGYGLEIK